MADHRLEDGVDMGKLDNNHCDNTLRLFTIHNRLHIQLRYESWYLSRKLERDEIIELIKILSTEYLEQTKEIEKALETV